MNAESDTGASRQRKPVTESPWYWLYVFCTAGLIGLLVIAPKFQARQLQIERNLQARQHAARLAAGETDAALPPESTHTSVTLWPLVGVLAALLAYALFKLIRTRRRPVLAREEAG